MISGNQTWTLALAQPQKQPLYVLEIPDFAIIVSSYGSVSSSTTGSACGYGVAEYGVGNYGV
jgi:hypothetical protein